MIQRSKQNQLLGPAVSKNIKHLQKHLAPSRGSITVIYKSVMYYIGIKCTPSFERKEMLHYKKRGRTEHDSSQATMLSTFVFRQVNTRVGKESEGLADLWAARA